MALKTRGVPTKLIVYPKENHELEVPSYLVHRMRSDIAWFDRWLKVRRKWGHSPISLQMGTGFGSFCAALALSHSEACPHLPSERGCS